MPFWLVVLFSLFGIPVVLFVTGMGMIFAAAGYANGSHTSHANRIVLGWLVFAWILASAFGAFGVVPAWRASHGGGETFAGGLGAMAFWMAGVAAAGLLAAGWFRTLAEAREQGADRVPALVVLRWVLLALGFVPWAALVAWLGWPLVTWALHGHFLWPDAATGWIHTAEVTALLVAAMLVEDAVRRTRKR